MILKYVVRLKLPTLLLFLFAKLQVAHGQTLMVGTASYPLVYYEDEAGTSAAEAVLEGFADEYQTKSYRIKVTSRTRSVYSDSQGARFPCRETKTRTICRASFKETVPETGTECTSDYNYTFRLNTRRRQVLADFDKFYSCEDGLYVLFRHSGVARYRVSR
jgi:hypothetical protein